MYLSGSLPPWPEICGKCRKNAKDDGEHEWRRIITEELMKRRSNKRERGRAHHSDQHRSLHRRDTPKYYAAQDQEEFDHTQPSVRSIPTDGASQKDFGHGEHASVSAIRDDNNGSSISTKGSEDQYAQKAQGAVAGGDTLDGGHNPTLAEQQEPRKSSRQQKSDEGSGPCESKQATQPQEKDDQHGHGPPTATAANTQQRQNNHGHRRDGHRQRGSASQSPPQPEHQPQQQHHHDNSRPKQARPMGISDMYWASEEGARESEFTGTFGFLGIYDYDSSNDRGYYHYGYNYNHDHPQHGVGTAFSGGAESFPATYPANCSCPETDDEASRYCAPSPTTDSTTSCSQGTTASSPSNSGRSRMSFATSIYTSLNPGGPADSGHFSTASAKMPSFPKTGQTGVPSPNRHQQRTTSRVWEVSSAEAEEIEKAHVKLFDVKPKGKHCSSSSSSTGK